MPVRKGFVAIAAVAAAALGLTACTGGSAADSGSGTSGAATGKVAGTITLQTWSLKNETFTPYFNQVVKDFEAKYPGTTVKWVDQPADGYDDKLLQQAESGELPDVVNVPPESAYSLAKAGQLTDLDQAAPGALNDYVDGAVKAYQYDGIDGSYGFPWYLGTSINFWNLSLFKKAGLTEADVPTDVDELYTVADKMAKSPAKVRTISAIPGPKDLNAQNDVPLFENGKFVFNTPAAAKVLDSYAQLYSDGALAPAAMQGAENGNANTFNQGTVAFTTATPYYPSKDLQINAPKLVPNVTANTAFGAPPLFAQGVSVAKDSQQPATAVAFAKFLTSDAEQVKFVKLAPGFLPGTKKANEDPSSYTAKSDLPLQNTASKLGADQMKTAAINSPAQYSDDMNTYAKQQFALAIKGDISSQEALDKAVKYCNDNLNS